MWKKFWYAFNTIALTQLKKSNTRGQHNLLENISDKLGKQYLLRSGVRKYQERPGEQRIRH